MAAILDKFPKLRVCAAHLGGFRQWKYALDVLADRNVWMDTSSCMQEIDDDTLRAILTSEYGLPPLLTDTIQLPPMPKPRAVNEQEMDSVAAWLREQNRLPKEYSTQKFLTRQIK